MKTPKQVNEHNAVITDMESEAGEHPIGKTVHISTVSHAFRGVLLAATPSYFILEKGCEIVLSTGEVGAYSAKKDSHASEAEKVNTEVRLLRSAAVWCLVY